jgi:hypothetical protein
MDFLRAWIRNLFIDLLVIAGVSIFMLIFMKIFYPDAFSILLLSGRITIGMINVMKLWPLVILATIVYAMPRRKRAQ